MHTPLLFDVAPEPAAKALSLGLLLLVGIVVVISGTAAILWFVFLRKLLSRAKSPTNSISERAVISAHELQPSSPNQR